MDSMLLSIITLTIGMFIGFIAGYFHRLNIEEEERRNV